jgi:drug/metabolite transporter (DMT)-like permease
MFKKTAFIIVLLSALLFGAATPGTKPLLSVFTANQMAGLLYLGAAIGVIFMMIKENQFLNPLKMTARNRIYLFAAVFFGGLLGPLFLMMGLKLASAASVSMWLTLEMVATSLIGHFFFKDHLTRLGWIGAAATVTAAIILAWGEGIAGIQAGILVALACCCWGIDNHATALIDEITPAQSTFWKGVVAGSSNLIIGLILAPMIATPIEIISGLGVGVFAYGISIMLYIMAAQQMGATRSQIVFSSAPFFGIFLSAVFLGEQIIIPQLISAFLIAGAIYMVSVENHQHNHEHHTQVHEHIHRHDDQHHDHTHPGEPAGLKHSHVHTHETKTHSHPHWPDLHHRHQHMAEEERT